ncbi:hypothetical protein K439DRAFT_57311 [Ramaria rubella]|nr:hypothetical protein K439DRAFT_57311 [Ramaria rubella]
MFGFMDFKNPDQGMNLACFTLAILYDTVHVFLLFCSITTRIHGGIPWLYQKLSTLAAHVTSARSYHVLKQHFKETPAELDWNYVFVGVSSP